MSNEKSRNLDNISDLLIVTKITERELEPEEVFDDEIICSNFSTELNREKERILLAEEHEAIVRKQQQMLQADERGKQALIAEIAIIKQKQEKRFEALRNRQRALDIERERSRRIASLPPPLPKSVKSLLRQCDGESKTNKPDVKMPDELTAVAITGLPSDCDEDKENFLNPEELEARRKIQEEWDLKAKQRFNEALKKDRQKNEYTRIMKQIEDAELQNRREMAKSISSEKVKNVPCPLSDKFQTAKNQVDMEDAAERIFKKNVKEHAIEDIEGYQDFYETKYKNIDSDFEEKMIDCVPSFVKDNYEYLLEDESKFQGGKHFSPLNDSGSDVFNRAYIETPPYAEDGEMKIDQVVDQLDKRRSELQTEYDQTVKPLLLAAMDIPRRLSSDKAVETDLFKQSTEDKAVGTEHILENRWASNDILNKLRTFKRSPHRPLGPFLPSFEASKIPDMHHRDVYYPLPAVPLTEGTSAPSWSSSSYCSVPSQHGFPNIPGSAESVKCDICSAERKNKFVKELSDRHSISSCVQLDGRQHDSPVYKSSSISSVKTSPTERPLLSEYAQKLAKKYLEAKSTSGNSSKENGRKSLSESFLPTHSAMETLTPAFEKRKVDSCQIKSYNSANSVSEPEKSYDYLSPPFSDSDNVFETGISPFEKSVVESDRNSFSIDRYKSTKSISQSEKSPIKIDHLLSDSSSIFDALPKLNGRHSQIIKEKSPEKSENFKDILNEELQPVNQEEKIVDRAIESPTEFSEYDAEVKRLQVIQQVLSRRIPSSDFNAISQIITTDESETEPVLENDYQKGVKPHVYHELSTIHEVDSGLTAGSLQLSQSIEKSLTKSFKDKSDRRKSKENLEASAERLKMISLLDPPDSEISELAKSIHFFSEKEDKASEPVNVPEAFPSASSNLMTSCKESLAPSPTPSSDVTSSSSSVSTPQGFSSSLTGSHLKYPFLKSTDILSKYFKDVSEVKRTQFSSSESSFKSQGLSSPALLSNSPQATSSSPSILSIIDAKRKRVKDDKLSNSNSLVSGFLSNARPDTSKNNEPVTNQGLLSGFISNENIYIRENEQAHRIRIPGDEEVLKYGSSSEQSGSFKPMTPHSDISTPSTINERKNCADSSSGSFKPMTPHSDISTPSTIHKRKNCEDSSSEMFNPMTPHSDISTPSIIHKRKNCADSSSESFKPMSPKSVVSSPSYSSDDVVFKDKFASLQRFNFPTPCSDSSKEINSKKGANKYMPQINYKSNMENMHPQSKQLSKMIGSEVKSEYNCSSNERKDQQLSNQQFMKDVTGETEPKQLAHESSPDFFVPRICAADVYSPKTENDLEEGTLSNLSSIQKQIWLKFNSKQTSLSLTPSSISSGQSDAFNDIKHSSSDFAEFYRNPKRNFQDILSRKPSDSCKNPDSFGVPSSLKKQYNNLKAISSTSSSNENLSDMFTESKFNYQSTPIKSLEDEMQTEKLISDEELTLVTITQTICKPDSPEQPRNPSQSSTPFLAAEKLNDKDRTLHLSESECKTPTNQSPQFQGSADTPSMLSFLHHEISCMKDKTNAEIPLSVNDQDSVSKVSENTAPNQNEVYESQQFPRAGYKQRTKRLWNNLEEVKKKNLAEERKKLMMVNRLKAKEFAKKITPKKKK